VMVGMTHHSCWTQTVPFYLPILSSCLCVFHALFFSFRYLSHHHPFSYNLQNCYYYSSSFLFTCLIYMHLVVASTIAPASFTLLTTFAFFVFTFYYCINSYIISVLKAIRLVNENFLLFRCFIGGLNVGWN
jgi:hypothetical protein